MKFLTRLFANGLVCSVVWAGAVMAGTTGSNDPVKVVYHFDGGFEQATKGLQNIKNHLDVDPTVRIVAVAHAKGVDFLLDGATNKTGNPYNIPVEELAARGVEFRVCAITLRVRGIDPKQLLPEAKIVPSGVVEIARLQAKEGFVYLKP